MLQRALVRLQQLSAIGSGSREERLRRATLLLQPLFTCVAGALWGLSYWLIGLPHVALVPFAYTFIVLFSIIGFIVSERFDLFARTQLSLLLLLPFVVQWMLGGFVPVGGVMLRGGSRLIRSPREPFRSAVSAPYAWSRADGINHPDVI